MDTQAEDPQPPEDESLVVDYVERALAARAAGTLDLDALCRAHPHLQPAVAEALAGAGALPRLQRDAGGIDPLLDTVLDGRYRLLDRIGAGAMGAVYRARDTTLERDVAVKILHLGGLASPTQRQRFRREAQVLAALDHPNVVAVHDRGEVAARGLSYLVMALLEGVPLTAVLRHAELHADEEPAAADHDGLAWLDLALGGAALAEPTYVRQVVRWAIDLAAGLQAAHDQRIYHRDVKPSNALVLRSGRAVLVDFGIAAAVRSDAGALTASGTTLGTPWYMAPEQALGQAEGGAAIDVYGLGATLYHLLCLRPPFDDEPARVLVRLQTEDPAPLRRLRPSLPRDLCAVVERCMERNPRRRYPSAVALAADLRAFLDGLPVAARPISSTARLWRRARRRPARALAVVLAVVLAVTGPLAVLAAVRERQRQRFAARDDLIARLPAMAVIEPYADLEAVADLAEARAVCSELDRILELDPAHGPTLLLRAAVREVLDDRSGAAADLQRLAEATKSPCLAAVAARYPAAAGLTAIDLAALPEPDVGAAHFFLGFVTARGGDEAHLAAAEQILAGAPRDYLPARDLRMLCLLALADRASGDERSRLYRLAYDESLELKARYGRDTARTLHVRATALIREREYAMARPLLEESLRLRPDRVGPLSNLAICALRLEDFAAAEAHARQALALRPDYWRARFTLSQVLKDTGRFGAALAEATDLPAAAGWRRPYQMAMVHLQQAYHAIGSGDRGVAREHAAAAVPLLDAAAALGRGEQVGSQRVVAAAIAEDRFDLVFTELARQLADGPLDATALCNLAYLLPPAPGSDEVAALQEFIYGLAAQLAPNDPMPRQHLEELRDKRR